MQKSETAKILKVLKDNYPKHYNDQDESSYDMMASMWTYQFQENTLDEVFKALNAAIAAKTDGFPPSIGEVKMRIVDITAPETGDAEDRWRKYFNAVKRASVHADEDYAAFPEDLKDFTSPGELRWQASREDFNESVEHSNFLRSWNARAEQRRIQKVVPPPVRKAMALAKERMLQQIGTEVQEQIQAPQPVEQITEKARQAGEVSQSIHELMEKKRRELEARNEK